MTDAVELVDKWFGGDAEWDRLVAGEALNAQIGQAVYDMRTAAGLTQQQLGNLVNTSQAVISKLENADYKGSAIDLFVRVCFALRRKVEILPVRENGGVHRIACGSA